MNLDLNENDIDKLYNNTILYEPISYTAYYMGLIQCCNYNHEIAKTTIKPYRLIKDKLVINDQVIDFIKETARHYRAYSLNILGHLCVDEHIIEYNTERVENYFIKSGELGNMQSIYDLAEIYSDILNKYFDFDKAVETYKLLLTKYNNTDAYKYIAKLYKNFNNHSMALNYYKKMVSLGSVDCFMDIADCYYVLCNYDKARKIYLKIINNRYPNYEKAYYLLGLMYYENRFNLDFETSCKKIKYYFSKAGKYGYNFSYYYLAYLYESGDNFEMDLKKAIKYYTYSDNYEKVRFLIDKIDIYTDKIDIYTE